MKKYLLCCKKIGEGGSIIKEFTNHGFDDKDLAEECCKVFNDAVGYKKYRVVTLDKTYESVEDFEKANKAEILASTIDYMKNRKEYEILHRNHNTCKEEIALISLPAILNHIRDFQNGAYAQGVCDTPEKKGYLIHRSCLDELKDVARKALWKIESLEDELHNLKHEEVKGTKTSTTNNQRKK